MSGVGRELRGLDSNCCRVNMEEGCGWRVGVENGGRRHRPSSSLVMMDPKELYLSSDLKDTKDSTSSSSDSGISNLDDVADYDTVTDLHLDSEFKDLDFSFDIDSVIKEENILFDSVPKLEDFASALSKDDIKAENFFNSDTFVLDAGSNVLVKSEPLSPSMLTTASSPAGGDTTMMTFAYSDLCGIQEQPISPDFYTVYDDGSLLNPESPLHSSLILSTDQNQLSQHQQLIIQQPSSQSQNTVQLQQQPQQNTLQALSSQNQLNNFRHGCIIQPSQSTHVNKNSVTTTVPAAISQQYTVVSTSPIAVSSHMSPCSPNSLPGQVLISPTSLATVINAPKFSQQQQLSSSSSSLLLSPSSPSSATTTHKNILVLPHQIKQEVILSPSPSSSSSSPSSPLSPHPSSLSPPLLPSSIIPSLTAKPSAAINLSAILNSKKKIQPKPGIDCVASTNQWLASHQAPLTTQAIPVAPGPAINSNTASLVPAGNCSLNDSKTMKRAQRIIKNRESASLSRKRKKEYLSSLEERLQMCTDENLRLQRENLELKQQLESLLTVNTQLKNPSGLSPAKKVCLMCFALFLAINISGFSLLSSSVTDYNQQTMGMAHHGTGRQLLSLTAEGDDNAGSYDDVLRRMTASSSSDQRGSVGRSSAAWLKKAFESATSWSPQDREMLRKMNWTQATHDMCAMAYINATESIRLAEKLTGWMQEEEKKRKKKEEKKKMGKYNGKKQKHYPTLRRFNSATAVEQQRQQQQQQQRGFHSSITSQEINSIRGIQSSFPLQVFNGPDERQQFLNAIPRRNDTFYVLSFSTDYLLVPASAHNKTMRPRMSLLMPVLSPSLNDSRKSGEENVAMMQIDCEILNTNLIHVHRSAFPREPTINGTSFGKGDNSPPAGSDRDEGSGGNKTETDHENYWARLKGSRK